MDLLITKRFSLAQYLKEKYQVIVFAVYLIILAISVAHHEPWMDEAQAWLLAKDLGFKELFVKYLRYEGSPGLWHLVLMIPAKLGLPYVTINILSAFFSAVGVWLFIRYAPFPILIKILYPFSFFVFFQYGIVARSYCLIAPILFSLAIIYNKRYEHPYIFVLLLCLLANISAHTFLIAGSIAFIQFLGIIKEWEFLDKRSKREQAISMLVFGFMALLVVFVVMTPPDQIYAGTANWGIDNFIRTTKRMVGGSLLMNEFSSLYWFSGLVSFIIFIITVIWLTKNKMALLYLLPLLLLSTLFAIKYRNLWHQGVLFLLWLFVLWVSYDKYRNRPRIPMGRTLIGAIALVLAVQAYWCFDALKYDLTSNYSGSYSLAKYIKKNGLQNEKIFVSGWKTISVLPYFNKNIFYNHNYGSNHRFWNWSVNNVTSVGATPFVLDTIGCVQPEVVIFASDHIPSRQRIELPGYKAVAFFKGYLCWKTGVIEPECYLVFRKKEPVMQEETEKIVYRDKATNNKEKSLQ
ncbi:MAG: hypothetical protein JWQ40_4546 [Segetibacter sp.]|nr:hypothetical protein [Segetibacter sp.]